MMPKSIKVCTGKKCTIKGAARILDTLEKSYPQVKVETCQCLGLCGAGPNVLADDKVYNYCRSSRIVTEINNDTGKPYQRIDKDFDLDKLTEL